MVRSARRGETGCLTHLGAGPVVDRPGRKEPRQHAAGAALAQDAEVVYLPGAADIVVRLEAPCASPRVRGFFYAAWRSLAGRLPPMTGGASATTVSAQANRSAVRQ